MIKMLMSSKTLRLSVVVCALAPDRLSADQISGNKIRLNVRKDDPPMSDDVYAGELSPNETTAQLNGSGLETAKTKTPQDGGMSMKTGNAEAIDALGPAMGQQAPAVYAHNQRGRRDAVLDGTLDPKGDQSQPRVVPDSDASNISQSASDKSLINPFTLVLSIFHVFHHAFFTSLFTLVFLGVYVEGCRLLGEYLILTSTDVVKRDGSGSDLPIFKKWVNNVLTKFNVSNSGVFFILNVWSLICISLLALLVCLAIGRADSPRAKNAESKWRNPLRTTRNMFKVLTPRGSKTILAVKLMGAIIITITFISILFFFSEIATFTGGYVSTFVGANIVFAIFIPAMGYALLVFGEVLETSWKGMRCC